MMEMMRMMKKPLDHVRKTHEKIVREQQGLVLAAQRRRVGDPAGRESYPWIHKQMGC